jgi:hypothetical protein
MIRRREFITLLGGAAAAWPLAAHAQQTKRQPTIGFLGNDAAMWRPWTAAFVQRLRELGWIEGRTIAVEYRWSEGRPERVAEIAAEFVRLTMFRQQPHARPRPLEIRNADDIAADFAALKAQADALYIVQHAFVVPYRTRIITLALGARLPTIFRTRDFVQAGALMSYGAKLSS